MSAAASTIDSSTHDAAAIARNVVVSFSTHVGSTIVVLLLTPLFVAKLGLEGYGLWALLSSVSRYGFLADFGLGPTLTKFLAEYIARGESRRTRELATFGVLFPIVVGVVATAATWFVAPAVLSIFHLPPSLRGEAPLYLCALVGYLFLFMASNVLTALLKGHGRLDVSAMGAAIGTLAFAACGAFFVLRGLGVAGLLYATFVQVIVTSAFNYVHLRRTYGPIFSSPFSLTTVNVRELFKMSGWIQLSVTFGFVLVETDLVVVGAFVGVAAVAIFDIGSKLARLLSAVSWHFNSALLPALSALDAHSEGDIARARVAMGSRYLGLISIVMTGFLIAAAPLVLQLWLGKTVGHTASVIAVVAAVSISLVATNIIGVVMTSLRAVGKPRLEVSYGGIAACSKIALIPLLVPAFGLAGVLACILLSTAAGSIGFLIAYRSSRPWIQSVATWLPKVTAASLVPACVVAFAISHLPAGAITSRIGSLASITVLGMAYLCGSVAMLRLLQFFDSTDVGVIRRIAPAGLARVTDSRAFAALLTSEAVA